MIRGHIIRWDTPVQVIGAYHAHTVVPPQASDIHVRAGDHGLVAKLKEIAGQEIVILTKEEYEALLVNKIAMTE